MSAFLAHTAMTTPGPHAAAVGAVPDDLSSLVATVRGLLAHCEFTKLYGLDHAQRTSVTRETLPLERRLDRIFEALPEPLGGERPFGLRELGTCRDYAIMICGMLREKHVPARVRCGFASYFSSGRYEDHWICEYLSPTEKRWVQVDGQLDEQHCAQLDVTFDTLDLPPGAFLTAREAWLLVRNDERKATLFGHAEAIGEWFLWVNLARDCLALRGQETSPWDEWRSCSKRALHLDEGARTLCDMIAQRISAYECERVGASDQTDLKPFW